MRIGQPMGVQELISEEEHPPEPRFRVVPETVPLQEPVRTPGRGAEAPAPAER